MVDFLEGKVRAWEDMVARDPRIGRHIASLSEEEQELFYLTVILNPYIPTVPFYNQVRLLTERGREVFYGGGRGGGKTEACLMGAFQFALEPGWSVGVFRLTYPELSNPKAIMDRALDWTVRRGDLPEDLMPKWSGEMKTLRFPSGATVKFGHVHNEADAEKYQGSEFHMIIVDEAPQFTESKIGRLKGSIRRSSGDPLPLREWYTGNPGGVGHEYFRARFVEGDGVFIQSLYTDNPFLDHVEYEKVFEEIRLVDPVLYRQWRLGDWGAVLEGALFRSEWFDVSYDVVPEGVVSVVRFWDLAGTYDVRAGLSGGADYTVGLLLLLGESGRCYVDDVVRFKLDPVDAEAEILRVVGEDVRRWGGVPYMVRFEQEGGASAKYVIDSFRRLLPGLDVDGHHVGGLGKVDRARALVPALSSGDILVRGGVPWRDEFVAELVAFPTKGVHDDQVDALSGAWHCLAPFHGNPYAVGGSSYRWVLAGRDARRGVRRVMGGRLV